MTVGQIREPWHFTTCTKRWSEYFPAMGCPDKNRDCRVHFFVSFLCKQKRKRKKISLDNQTEYVTLCFSYLSEILQSRHKIKPIVNAMAAPSEWQDSMGCKCLPINHYSTIKSLIFSNHCNAWYLSRHQGTKALHHFAPKLIGKLPGNGLFIIVPIKIGTLFCFFFVQAKKKREKIRITE